MKCPNCGNESQDDAVFCDQCGTRLKPAQATPAAAPVSGEVATAPQVSAPPPQPAAPSVAAPMATMPEVQAAPATVCPKCGHNNTPGEVFCSECGTRLAAPAPESTAAVEAVTAPPVASPAMGVCPVCGASVGPNDEFCDACGADLRAKTAEAVAPAPGPAAPAPQAEAVEQAPAPAPSAPTPEPVAAAPLAAPAQAPAAPAPQPAPQEAPTCPSCGAPIGPDDTFCQNCGAALVSAGGVAPAPTAAPPVTTPSAAQPAPVQPAVTQGGDRPRLVVADSGVELPIKVGQETLVGREDPTSGIFPDVDLAPHGGMEGGVSRRHFKITFAGGQYMIEDLNSTNYTIVNRQRVQPGQPMPLADGDQVRAGRVSLVFKVRA